jgi:hypothetical protein
MKKLVLIAVIALALPAAALAKGPSAASIEGPGVKTITMSAAGEEGDASLFWQLTEAAGFFAVVYSPSPDPMLRTRPKGDLGPRYTITWVLPMASGKSTLHQDVYPYAKPNPLTYMRPGQTFYNSVTTNGGWYVGGAELKQALVSVGLPAKPPSAGEGLPARPPSAGGSGLSTGSLAGIAAAGTGVLALLLVTRIRRRARPAVRA